MTEREALKNLVEACRYIAPKNPALGKAYWTAKDVLKAERTDAERITVKLQQLAKEESLKYARKGVYSMRYAPELSNAAECQRDKFSPFMDGFLMAAASIRAVIEEIKKEK